MSTERTRVYVAGPYSQGDQALNVRAAVYAGRDLLNADYAPFVPHLTHFWHMLCPQPYEAWLELDRQWLLRCHGLLRLPGESKGAEMEMGWAADAGIPIFHKFEDLVARLPRTGLPCDFRQAELVRLQRRVAELEFEREAHELDRSVEEHRRKMEEYRQALFQT